MSGSTANRSTMPSTWSARPMPTGPSSTPSAPTRRWPGTGRHRSTAGWRTRPSPTFPSPKSCQLLDAGHPAVVNHLLDELQRLQTLGAVEGGSRHVDVAHRAAGLPQIHVVVVVQGGDAAVLGQVVAGLLGRLADRPHLVPEIGRASCRERADGAAH